MVKSIKNFFNKPISNRSFSIVLILLVVSILLPWIMYDIYDNDMYFLIATGREIRTNGIPYTNIWSIDKSDGFIAQQWLYTVILSIVTDFGPIACSIFVCLELAILGCLITHFFKLKHINNKFIIFSIVIILFYSKLYMFNLRPQLITVILLMIECIGLEHYKISNKPLWLTLLPFSMLLEINLHSSMWPMHYAILFAYIIQIFGLHKSKIKITHIIPTIVLMSLVMFINPYGIDNITYTMKTFAANTFSYVAISEIQKPIVLSIFGLSIITNIALICIYFKSISYTTLNITLGITFMMLFSIRNQMFEPIVLMYILSDINVQIKQIIQKITVKPTIIVNSVLIFATTLFTANCLTHISYASITNSTIQKACEYISEKGIENPKVFTGFNTGGYFEWQGFTNVYVDARPELYTSEFTNDKNIIADYSTYCINGIHLDKMQENYNLPVTSEEMYDWFNSYNFDYVYVDNSIEHYLAAFMLDNTNYQIVDKCTSNKYVLYEKKD